MAGPSRGSSSRDRMRGPVPDHYATGRHIDLCIDVHTHMYIDMHIDMYADMCI